MARKQRIATSTETTTAGPSMPDLLRRLEEDVMSRAFQEAADDYASDGETQAWLGSNNHVHE